MRKRVGFTLIELLVVIAIMSILTIVTVGQFSTAKRKGRDSQRKSDLDSLSKALQMYYADYGVFPEKDDVVFGGEFVDGTYVYMKVVPSEKSDDLLPFCYDVASDRKSFGLFAQMENTADADCSVAGYLCDGVRYCYGVVSPNIKLGDEIL